MSAGKCPMGQSLGVSRGTALSVGRLGQLGQTGQVGHDLRVTARGQMTACGNNCEGMDSR